MKTINGSSERPGFWKTLLIFLGVLGPGIITASAGNDAGGIATYSVAGAHFGYSVLWVFLPMAVPLIVLQEMCTRMGVVTGKGLSDLIREKFGVKVTFYAMIMFLVSSGLNTLSEFSGIAASWEIFGVPKYVSLPVSAIVLWYIIVKGTYKSIEKIFFLGVFFYVAYVITGFMVHPDWSAVAGQMVMPQFRPEKSYLIIVMGLLGTTIAPWMQFYQQSTVVEKGLGVKDYKYARIDVVIGGLVMIVVALFIVIACSGTLFRGGIRIETAKDAALALKPLAGEHCSALFAFGLLNASFVSAMILPIAAAYSVCEGLGWEAGVDKRLKDAPQFYFLFTILILIGAGIVMVPGISLIKIMLFSQVANSIFLPFVLVFILILVNDRHLMGEHKNSRFFNIISWATVAVLLALTAGLMATIFSRRP